MNKEVTEAIEFLQWLLEGLIKFHPDNPLFSHIEVTRVKNGKDRWPEEDGIKLFNLAKKSLELPEGTTLDQVILKLQNLIENPEAFSTLPDPVLARIRE